MGIPLMFAVLLWLNRDVLGGRVGGVRISGKWWYGDDETFNFLVDGYRPETFWYGRFAINPGIRSIAVSNFVLMHNSGTNWSTSFAKFCWQVRTRV